MPTIEELGIDRLSVDDRLALAHDLGKHRAAKSQSNR